MRYMLDTNICIYAIKHKPQQVFENLNKHDPQEICISSVTYAELVYGVQKSMAKERNRLALTLLLSSIQIMDFDAVAAECYGEIRTQLEKEGNIVGPMDLMIASHARALDCVVVTNNSREFNRIKGLKVENWAE